MCWRSVVAPAIRSSRVAEPGNELYGVCAMATSWYSLLLQQVHQPQAVLGQQDAVGVQRQHVVGVGDERPGPGLVRTSAVPPGVCASRKWPPISPM